MISKKPKPKEEFQIKAIYLEKYGSTENLTVKEYPKPDIQDDLVLVKLLYTSINSADLGFINGHPLVRFTGLFKPGYPVLGSDCVGQIEPSTTEKRIIPQRILNMIMFTICFARRN